MKFLLFVGVLAAYVEAEVCRHDYDCGVGDWCCQDECISTKLTACSSNGFDGMLFMLIFIPFVLVSTCVGVFVCVQCHMCCWAPHGPQSPPNYMLVDGK